MLSEIKKQLQVFIQETLSKKYSQEVSLPAVELEVPANKEHGDFSTNIALKSAQIFRKAPLIIAKEFMEVLNQAVADSTIKDVVLKTEVKAPGFINFYLKTESFIEIISDIFEQSDDYGRCALGQKERIQIEFVSANPTGPLSVAHARQAVVGDVLANILNFLGFDVKREYYVNDGGNQIRILGQSLKLRMLEILGEPVDFPDDYYQGSYIKEMAAQFFEELKKKDNKLKEFDQKWVNSFDNILFEDFAKNFLLDVIKKELLDFGVEFDFWAYESKIAGKEQILKLLDYLKERGHTKEEDGALWFKSTELGDDKDRVLRKTDGMYTYLTPDIVYHKDKFERGFNRVFNIWGPDHHGYIPRIKAAAQALGKDQKAVEVLIVQLATLYRDGQAVSMSTRKGEFISLREVMDEVGVDAARYFFLMRHISAHLEFDLELAKKQSSENPVFYIQYAHARVFSINDKASSLGIERKTENFKLLKESEEVELIKKLGNFQHALINCYQDLDPYGLVSYLHELATCFHKFYDRHRVVDEDKELSKERLGLVNAARIVIHNGLMLLGINAPEKM